MINLIFYLFLTIISLFFFGFGISGIITPKPLSKFILWLSPWYAIIFIAIFSVIFSLLGIPAIFTAPVITALLSILTVFVVFNKNLKIFQNGFFDLILILFVIGSSVFNVSPLIRREKMMTTISLGNNDVISYVSTGDYLVKSTIFKSLDTPIPGTEIDNLLYKGYRWGVPAINAFFLNIFNLEGYQFTYVLQVVLFGVMIPLQYILFKILYGKKDHAGFLLTLVLTALNVNLLYILYHNFFGEVLFWGLEIFIYIFLYSYFSSDKIEEKSFNVFDYVLGFSLSALFFSYHEPLIFIILPLLFFLILTAIKDYKKTFTYFYCYMKIALITFLTSSFSIFFAFILDYIQGIKADPNQPIGWALFRTKIPFANPFEAIGLWSIHSFAPLPTIIAISLSLLIIFFIIFGLLKSKYKLLSVSFLIVYAIFYYWTVVMQKNFYTYNRALTYSLPLLLVIFSIGIITFFRSKYLTGLIVIIVLIALELFSGMKLNKRFRAERLSVDKSYISIKDLKKIKITGPIYAESLISNNVPLWKMIWDSHFLYTKNISQIPTVFNDSQYENRVPDGSLVLISKPTPWLNPLKIIFKDIIWSNDYYNLGHICNADDCLIKLKEKLNEINISKNNFEDSLLINGWNISEGKTRWANEKESILRLVTKDTYPANLTVEALSLSKSQKVTVYLDEKLLGQISIDTEWKDYSLPINFLLDFGVHRIKFVYSHGYRPIDIIPGNLDGRTLYVNFKRIALE